VMFEAAIGLDEIRRFLEQVFETQERADTLIERVFVGDHSMIRSPEGAIRSKGAASGNDGQPILFDKFLLF